MRNCTLLPPSQWAQTEFALAELGDKRRTDRLMSIAENLARSPGGTLPQAFPAWKDLKAAYRFFAEPSITRPAVLAPHLEQTRAALRAPGKYLVIEDTTTLDFSLHPGTQGLGTVGNGHGRGFLVHSALAWRVEAWNLNPEPAGTALGLVEQHCWSRRPAWKPKRETQRQARERSRESQRWATAVETCGPPPGGCQWIWLGDREADFYEPMAACRRQGWDFIIRSCHNRALSQSDEHLAEAAGRLALRGRMRVSLRARPGAAARQALVEVRSGTLTVRGPWRAGQRLPDFTLNVIEVQEVDAPPDVTPLHWRLLSSLPCQQWKEVRRIVGRYAMRWRIEEYHKALKTGAGAEKSQLEHAYRIETLLGVLAVVAVRLLNLQYLAQAQPETPVDPTTFGAEPLELLAQIFGRAKPRWTYRSLLIAIAQLGGFPARKGDGLPGWQRIWRGWERLMWMSLGWAAQAHGPPHAPRRSQQLAEATLAFFNLGGGKCG